MWYRAVLFAIVTCALAACSSGPSASLESNSGGTKDQAQIDDGSSRKPTGNKGSLVPTAVVDWQSSHVANCKDWTPTDGPEVVFVKRITSTGMGRSALEVTKVFSAPTADPLAGENWSDTTTPWIKVDGHQVMRVTRGHLLNLDARDAAGALCADCGGYVLIVGPHANELLDNGVIHIDG